MSTQTITYDLGTLPEGAVLQSVTATPVTIEGKQALRVTLTDEVSKGVPDVDFVDMPTFLMIPAVFKNGTISVNVYSRLRDDAPDHARGFAGLSYRIGDDSFEAAYVRPLNGLKVNPEPPRDKRAVQYFAYPDWRFERLRQEYPDGRFEAGANIGPSEWINLKLEIDETRLTVFVDGNERLTLDKTMAEVTTGNIGLFVDIGTEAFFSNLQVTHR
ncbi:MAG: hypothetical protein ABF649_04090 [Bacillus sp. (in: firmicutes)]